MGAQRSKKGLSYLKELQVRASKRQGVLSADGGRQSRSSRPEADGWWGGRALSVPCSGIFTYSWKSMGTTGRLESRRPCVVSQMREERAWELECHFRGHTAKWQHPGSKGDHSGLGSC